jgi:hypothetical protein
MRPGLRVWCDAGHGADCYFALDRSERKTRGKDAVPANFR